MAFDSVANLLETTLGAPRTSGSSIFTVKTGDGTRFGSVASLLFAATPVTNVASTGRFLDRTKVAFYRATGRSGDDLTGCTLVEGTDRDYAAGDLLGVYVTAQHIQQLQDAVNALGSGGSGGSANAPGRIYAPAPSGGDDTATLQALASQAGSGRLILTAGVYRAWLNWSGLACGLEGQGGEATIIRAPSGATGLPAGQTRYVLSLTGMVSPPGFLSKQRFADFTVEGMSSTDFDNPAFVPQGVGGIHAQGVTGLIMEGVTARYTDGPGFWLSGSQFCSFRDLVLASPLDAGTANTPWLYAAGAFNACVIDNLLLRGVHGLQTDPANVGAVGAVVLESTSTQAANGLSITSMQVENLLLGTGATILRVAGNTNWIGPIHVWDTNKAAGATDTWHVCLDDPVGTENSGGNIVMGVIPGTQGGTTLDGGVRVAQDNNLIWGSKGYNGPNVVLQPGVSGTTVWLAGSVSASTTAGVVNNSGNASNTIVDLYNQTMALGGTTLSTSQLTTTTVRSNLLQVGPDLLEIREDPTPFSFTILFGNAVRFNNIAAMGGATNTLARLWLYTRTTDTAGLSVQGLASQTAPLIWLFDVNSVVLGSWNADGSISVGNQKVVGPRGAAVADSDGTLADTVRAVNALLARLRATGGHGLIAD